MEHPHSLTVNGSGNSAGGDYNKVKIRGEGTISNDMSCNEFKTYGTSDVRGNMKVKIMLCMEIVKYKEMSMQNM